jgi:hypothetical protein
MRDGTGCERSGLCGCIDARRWLSSTHARPVACTAAQRPSPSSGSLGQQQLAAARKRRVRVGLTVGLFRRRVSLGDACLPKARATLYSLLPARAAPCVERRPKEAWSGDARSAAPPRDHAPMAGVERCFCDKKAYPLCPGHGASGLKGLDAPASRQAAMITSSAAAAGTVTCDRMPVMRRSKGLRRAKKGGELRPGTSTTRCYRPSRRSLAGL